MTWSTKINSGKIFNVFSREKKYLKFLIPKYLISKYTRKKNLYKRILLRIVKTLSTTKVSSSEIYEDHSLFDKNIPTKYLKSLSMKIIFLDKAFILSFNFSSKKHNIE